MKTKEKLQPETEATEVKSEAGTEDDTPKVRFWKYLFPYLKPFRGQLILSLVLSAVCGACLSIQPLVIKYLVDSGISGEPFFGRSMSEELSSRVTFIVIFALTYIAVSIIRIYSYRFSYTFQLRSLKGCMLAFKSNVFSHIQHLCMRFFDKTPSGEIFNYIMGSPMGNVESYINSVTLGLPYKIISLLFSMGALVAFDWQLSVVMIFTAAAMAAMNFLSRKRVRRAAKARLEADRLAATYITDMLHGIDTVKTYSIEDTITDKSVYYMQDAQQKAIVHAVETIRANSRPEAAQYIGTAIIYIVGGIACLTRGMTVGMLYAFLSSMGIILDTLNTFLSLGFTRNEAEVALDKIVKILNTQPTTPEPLPGRCRSVSEEMKRAETEGAPCVFFRNVAFTYDKKEIFRNFSCEIPYHQSVALVGRSGSGKSTFVKLLLRLYESDRGYIGLHNNDIRDYPLHELRASFGVVPQSPYIFHDTIRNNIISAAPFATEEEIENACKIAHVKEFVDTFPLGMDTVIGDGAQSLSGGQKQRLAIARAVLKPSDFLIFDEATSALDNISERHIQHAMESLMKTHTVIIIAHRLSTIKNVDRIMVFEDGNIVQEGNYAELSSKPGKFRDMLDVVENDEDASFAISNA